MGQHAEDLLNGDVLPDGTWVGADLGYPIPQKKVGNRFKRSKNKQYNGICKFVSQFKQLKTNKDVDNLIKEFYIAGGHPECEDFSKIIATVSKNWDDFYKYCKVEKIWET